MNGYDTVISTRHNPTDTAGRVMVTWDLAAGISSALHVLWECHQASMRRSRVLEHALRQSRADR